MSNARKLFIYLILATVLLFSGMFFIWHKNRLMPVFLPPAQTYQSAVNSESENSTPTTSAPALPAEVNLEIPFTVQAPHQNWDVPYQQFCEEAAMLMAASYVKSETISSPNEADAKLLAVKDFEEKNLGFYEDTNAEETATVIREYYGLTKVEVVSDPTVQNIKNALAEGRAVIVPSAGRQVGNPYYRQPGPLYHMLVVKGYTKNGDFITNDPGTRRGADYIYKPDTIMNAIHDWNGGNVDTGRKVMIIVG